jgi:hypothetical protein
MRSTPVGRAAAEPQGLGRAARRRRRPPCTTCTSRATRRGLLEFSAWEQRVGELAWIVDAAVLERELAAALRFAPHVTLHATTTCRRRCVALVRRQRSSGREALGVGVERHDYGHRAIAARLAARSRIATPRASGSARPTCWRCCRSTRRSRSVVRARLVAAERARRCLLALDDAPSSRPDGGHGGAAAR